jgi:thiosulfate/3-mercaptopyruvate sulfurtransferase
LVQFNTLIDAASLRTLLATDAAAPALIDCRFDLLDPGAGYQAYLSGHIPRARFADLNQDLSAPISPASGRHPLPEPQVFAATLGKLGIHNGTQVVAYDQSNGSFAARLWWMLRWLGHPAVAVLDGGMKAWLSAGGPLSSGQPELRRATPREASITAAVDRNSVVSAAQVAELLRDPQRLLVDARAAERFAGSVEPIDSVAGHIAGALNHPFTTNLASDGRFLPAKELRQRWEAQLAGRRAADVVAMCGSGVTACHNLLSLEIAGLSGAKLYPGSWSEWIRDPNRPVARGS